MSLQMIIDLENKRREEAFLSSELTQSEFISSLDMSPSQIARYQDRVAGIGQRLGVVVARSRKLSKAAARLFR